MSKWLNKRRQAAKEALNKNAAHTDIDNAYVAMETEVDATRMIVEGMVKKLPYYIHPNPAERLKSQVKNKGQAKYKHAIQELIDLLQKHAPELDQEGALGMATTATASTFQDILDKTYELDDEVNQTVIDPWKQMIENEFKQLAHHRKKVRSRRLDYDFKRTTNESNLAKGKPEKYPEAEVKVAEEKFNESLQNAEAGMGNIIDNDGENISPLKALVEAQRKFYLEAADKLTDLSSRLDDILSESANRPKRSFQKVDPIPSAHSDDEDAAPASPPVSAGATPCAKALYDFEAENDGELEFKEDDMITLTSRIDENWLEGTVNGKSGMFPSTYVEIINDI